MNRLRIFLFLSVLASLRLAAHDCAVIPSPVQYGATGGVYAMPGSVAVAVPVAVADDVAANLLRPLNEAGVATHTVSSDADLTFVIAETDNPEGYELDITPTGVTVVGGSERGLYNGMQTLAQLVRQSADRTLATAHIADYPRFGYRSLMLDAVRYFIPKEEVMKIIDVAASLKLNNLHLHLTDDNGWRLEIKKYPRLTEVGAWRVYRSDYFPGRLNQTDPAEPTPVGGFYTQDDMREIVRYAQNRFINVVPEIEMPAHAAAAIASYPELACPVTDKFVGVFPGIGGKDASIIMCAGNEKVYEFYQDVLDEVIDIFPSKYIHLGGDEAEKSHWKECPLCNKRIEDEGLAGFEELQAYFMDRINHYVRSKGRTAMGWDEVTYGDPKEEMVIVGWQGTGNVAVNDARRSGRKFVLSPAKVLYLLRYQGPQWFEPFTYFGNNTLSDVYFYEPVKADWTPELKERLLGVQGSLWTEFCQSPEDVEYLIFPRLMAVADMAWRPEGKQDWPKFLAALDAYLPQLAERDMTYAKSMFNIQHTAVPDGQAVNLTLECIRPDVEIRLVEDGVPLAEAVTYAGPVRVASKNRLHAFPMKDGEVVGQELFLDFDFNKATGRKVTSPNCNNNLTDALTNGLRGSAKISDFEWAGWHNRDAEFVVDLGETGPLGSVTLGTIAHTDICVAAPRQIELYASTDGENYTRLRTVTLPNEVVFAKKARKFDLNLGTFDNEARYVRIVARNPGVVPENFARESTPTWLYFDEITINQY